jgi:segregation and condensation protein A
LVVPEGEPSDAGGPTWSLHLPQFEGPLDLLLHLCQKHELNILDIPVGFVTEKYLEHLAVMELMQLDLAADYLVMAATLAHIKSKMLLPATPTEEDDDSEFEDEMDPREALIRRLLEYQKYKAAGEDLVARGVAGRDVFVRGTVTEQALAGEAPLAAIPLFALVDAFQRVLDRTKVKLSHEIVPDRVSITERIAEISDVLAMRHSVTFDEMFENVATKFELVITFLALLEMARLKMTLLRQDEPLGPLHIELAVPPSTTEPTPNIEGETP